MGLEYQPEAFYISFLKYSSPTHHKPIRRKPIHMVESREGKLPCDPLTCDTNEVA